MDWGFYNRQEAGRMLAEKLSQYEKASIVLALPRGGVVVGYEIAKSLRVKLSILVVRKLGVPWQKELGFGAIAENGSLYIDQTAVGRLGLGKQAIDNTIEEETSKLKKRIKLYRERRQLSRLSHKVIILVDDGIATGVTMLAALQTTKKHQPKMLIVAVPVCSQETAEKIRQVVDNFICLHEVGEMQSIGMYYENFWQVADEEVVALLQKNKAEEVANRKKIYHKRPHELVAM